MSSRSALTVDRRLPCSLALDLSHASPDQRVPTDYKMERKQSRKTYSNVSGLHPTLLPFHDIRDDAPDSPIVTPSSMSAAAAAGSSSSTQIGSRTVPQDESLRSFQRITPFPNASIASLRPPTVSSTAPTADIATRRTYISAPAKHKPRALTKDDFAHIDHTSEDEKIFRALDRARHDSLTETTAAITTALEICHLSQSTHEEPIDPEGDDRDRAWATAQQMRVKQDAEDIWHEITGERDMDQLILQLRTRLATLRAKRMQRQARRKKENARRRAEALAEGRPPPRDESDTSSDDETKIPDVYKGGNSAEAIAEREEAERILARGRSLMQARVAHQQQSAMPVRRSVSWSTSVDRPLRKAMSCHAIGGRPLKSAMKDGRTNPSAVAIRDRIFRRTYAQQTPSPSANTVAGAAIEAEGTRLHTELRTLRLSKQKSLDDSRRRRSSQVRDGNEDNLTHARISLRRNKSNSSLRWDLARKNSIAKEEIPPVPPVSERHMISSSPALREFRLPLRLAQRDTFPSETQ